MSGNPLVSRGSWRDSLEWRVRRVLYRLRSGARPFLRRDVALQRLHGRVTNDGTPVSVVLAGWKRTLEYFVRRLGLEESSREDLGTTSVLRLPAVLESLGEKADLVMARVPHPGARWLFGDDFLRVPEAVESRLEVPDRVDDLARASTRARRNLSRVRRNGLTWSISLDERDFDRFYRDFYLPFLRNRFVDLSHEIDRETLLRAFRHGCLLWVEREGRRIAAALLQPEERTLRWRVMGARTDVADPAKVGALAAIYVFSAECAARHGYRWLDLGYSSASLRDGVLSHKSSWGARLYCPWIVDHDLIFRWRRLDDVVLRFLAEAPLVFREGRELSAVAALPPSATANRQAARTLLRKSWVPGLRRLFVVARGGWPRRAGPGEPEKSLWLADPGSPRRVISGAFPDSDDDPPRFRTRRPRAAAIVAGPGR